MQEANNGQEKSNRSIQNFYQEDQAQFEVEMELANRRALEE
jgi:hypothetical protein